MRPLPQLASLSFGGRLADVLFGVLVPAVLLAAPLLAAVLLAAPLLAAVPFGAGRAGVLWAAGRAGAFGSALAAATGFGSLTATGFGSLAVTASLHTRRPGTLGSLEASPFGVVSLRPGRSGAVTFSRSSANFRWLARSCPAM